MTHHLPDFSQKWMRDAISSRQTKVEKKNQRKIQKNVNINARDKYLSFVVWGNEILQTASSMLKIQHFREGKGSKKYGLLPNPPRTPPPPPGLVIFPTKKIYPQFFFLEIRPLLGETNFTLGPISKSIIFCSYNGFYNCLLSPQDLGRSGYFKSCPNSCRYEIGTPDQV